MIVAIIVTSVICLGVGVIYWRLSIPVYYGNPDEGYLWYGVLRTREGKVPIRDFRAYDPGRYYLLAWLGAILGDNIRSIRNMSLGIYLVLLLPCLWIHYSLQHDLVSTSILALLLMIFSYPHYKAIDTIIPSIITACIALALNLDTAQLYVLAGAIVGASCVIGFNHLLYSAIAVGLTFTLSLITDPQSLSSYMWFIAGGLLGLVPMMLFLSRKGVASAYYLRKIRRVLDRGTTNLKIELPLPWKRPDRKLTQSQKIDYYTLGLAMVSLPLLYITLIVHGLYGGHVSLTMVASAAGVGYFNHFYSRADTLHLQLSVVPLLWCVSALESKSLLYVIMIAVMVFLVYQIALRLLIKEYKTHRLGEKSTILPFPHAQVWVSAGTARFYSALDLYIRESAISRDRIYCAPILPHLLPLMRITSPVYDTFPVYPGSKGQQEEMITQLKRERVQLVIIRLIGIDFREDLKFHNSYPLVWKYLQEHYTVHRPDFLPKQYRIFKALDL